MALDPLPIGAVPELVPMLQKFQNETGYAPNAYLIMQRKPSLVGAFAALVETVIWEPGDVSVELRHLIAIVASQTTGCMYCQANTTAGAVRTGTAEERVAALCNFRDSPLFSPAERIAFEFAQAAASVPNGVTSELMAELATHWSDDQIVEILAVVCLKGFVNRWNDSVGTVLPESSVVLAAKLLGPSGWHVPRVIA
jgi:uncharacterized peroxidase-related enzyme